MKNDELAALSHCKVILHSSFIILHYQKVIFRIIPLEAPTEISVAL